ncbi:MAG: PP2C family protein-serine/threonine phosphatase [Candidatus Krumholzibacteriia bacterium]
MSSPFDHKSSKTPAILVVDDETVVTESVAAFLELETDYNVFQFQSPLAALEFVRETPIDVVISDFLMPEVNGLEFLAEVKKLYPDVPRIMLTGYADKENSIRAINEVGLFQYIEKPWDNDHFRLTIENALANKSLNESLTIRIRELDRTLRERDKLAARDELLREELSIASRLQQSMLPREFPGGDRFSYCARYLPALEIGGDFYDAIPLAGDRTALLLADATGHGIQAALSTAIVKFAFSRFANRDVGPGEILEGMNRTLSLGLPADTFVAATVLTADPLGRCQLANAGVPHPFLMRRRRASVERVIANGFVLGVFDNDVYRYDAPQDFELKSGDRLILYTDGLGEPQNGKGEQFDTAMMKRSLLANVDEPSEKLFASVVDASRGFSHEGHNWDDITIIDIAFT